MHVPNIRTPVVLASLVLAQCTALANAQTADASQSAAISAAIASYTHSLLTGPIATSIALEVELAGNVPQSEIASIASGLPTLLPSLTSGEDLYSFATDPPTAFAEPAWVASLPGDVRSDVEALRTSVYLAEASIVASVLGVTREAVTATAVQSSTAATGTSAATGAGVTVLAWSGWGTMMLFWAVVAVVGAVVVL